MEFRPKRSRNVSPLTLTVPSSPVSVSLSTRPPQSPFPSRRSTSILVRLPRPGHCSSIAASSSFRVQSWYQLPDQSSYGSFFAGRYENPPADVQPPLLAENCVNAGVPALGQDLARGRVHRVVGGGVLRRVAAVHLAVRGVADLVVPGRRVGALVRRVGARRDGLRAHRVRRATARGPPAARRPSGSCRSGRMLTVSRCVADPLGRGRAQDAAVAHRPGGREQLDRPAAGGELRVAADHAPLVPPTGLVRHRAAATGRRQDPPPLRVRARSAARSCPSRGRAGSARSGHRPPRLAWCRP